MLLKIQYAVYNSSYVFVSRFNGKKMIVDLIKWKYMPKELIGNTFIYDEHLSKQFFRSE